MAAAYDAVHREAELLGVEIESAEIVGLCREMLWIARLRISVNSKTFLKRRSWNTRSISVHPCNPWLRPELDKRSPKLVVLLHQLQILHFFTSRLCSNNSRQLLLFVHAPTIQIRYQ